MSSRDLATMAVRLIALYALARFVFDLSTFFTAPETLMSAFALQALGALVASAGLWIAAVPLGRVLGRSDEPMRGLLSDTGLLVQTAFGVAGVLLAAMPIPELALTLWTLLTPEPVATFPQGPSPALIGQLAGTLTQVALGLALFLARGGLARLFGRIRV